MMDPTIEETALVPVDVLDRALVETTTLQETVLLVHQATLLEEYARKVQMSLPQQNAIVTVRLTAMRKSGQFLLDEARAAGGRPRKNLSDTPTGFYATLRRLGVKKDDAYSWQRMASVPEDRFDRWLKEQQKDGGEITTRAFQNLADRYFGVKPHVKVRVPPSDWWSFPNPHWPTPPEFPGSIPGDVYLNALYYWGPDTGVVVDPMAGSGTLARVVEDASEEGWLMDRAYHPRLYDFAPREPWASEYDIRQHDCRAPLPVRADFIFCDPPYYKIGPQFADELGQASTISAYAAHLALVVDALATSLNPDGVLCLYMPPYVGDTEYIDVPELVSGMARASGLHLLRKVFVNRGIQAEGPDFARQNNHAVRTKHPMNAYCELSVWKKPQ